MKNITYKRGEMINYSLGINEDYESHVVVVTKEFSLDVVVKENSLKCPYDIQKYLLENGYIANLKLKGFDLGQYADNVDIFHFE